MGDESAQKFKLLLCICLITVSIEIGLSAWSSFVISQLDFSNQPIVTIQLASKGIMTYVTLAFGSLVTTSVSVLIPQIRVCSLYKQITDERFSWASKVILWAYVFVPTINMVSSLIAGYNLLRTAGLSLFDVIAYYC